VKGVENEEIILNELFTYELDKVDENGKVQGSFKAVNKPSFMNLFKRRGVKLDESIFTPDK
jgi:hypothetical protein